MSALYRTHLLTSLEKNVFETKSYLFQVIFIQMHLSRRKLEYKINENSLYYRFVFDLLSNQFLHKVLKTFCQNVNIDSSVRSIMYSCQNKISRIILSLRANAINKSFLLNFN